MNRFFACAGCAVLLGSAISANASPVTFFGEDTNFGNVVTTHPNSDSARNNFFANLSGVGTETFESYATGTTFPLTVTFPGAGTANLTGTGDIASGVSGSDQFPISGTQYLNTTGTFALGFTSPISAFGFYGTDIGDVGATLTLTLTGSNGSTTLTVPNEVDSSANGSALYYGFYDTSNTYSSISFAGAGSDVFGFDDFSIGSKAQVVPSAVPEPGTWAMMLLGFGFVGCALRSRRRQNTLVTHA